MKTINKYKLVGLAALITTNSLFAQILTNSDFGDLTRYNAFAGKFFEVKDATYAGHLGLADKADGEIKSGAEFNGNVYRHTGSKFKEDGNFNGMVYTSGAINNQTTSAYNRFTPLKNKIEGFTSSTGNLGDKKNGNIVFSTVGNVSALDVMYVIDYDKVELKDKNRHTIQLTGRAGFNDVFLFRMKSLDAKHTRMDLTNVSASNIIWYGKDKAFGNHSKATDAEPGDSFSGILFSPENEAKVGGGGVFEGAVYANEIKIGSGAVFTGVAPVPEPTSTILVGLGAIALIMRRKR